LAQRGGVELADIAVENLKGLPGVSVSNYALWRSDDHEPHALFYNRSKEEENTGGGGLFTEDVGVTPESIGGVKVISFPFDRIIDKINSVRFLKMDCEGSEFPILYTSKYLHRIEEIAGEYHEMPGVTFNVGGFDKPAMMRSLADHLLQNGFMVQIEPIAGTNLGHFYARKCPD